MIRKKLQKIEDFITDVFFISLHVALALNPSIKNIIAFSKETSYEFNTDIKCKTCANIFVTTNVNPKKDGGIGAMWCCAHFNNYSDPWTHNPHRWPMTRDEYWSFIGKTPLKNKPKPPEIQIA